MTAAAGIVALLATILLGILVGVFFLGRIRRPLAVRLHQWAAFATTALVAALVLLAPGGIGRSGAWAIGLLGLATGVGYFAFRARWPARRGSDAALIAHIALGLAGFFVFLAWRKTL